MFRLSPLPLAAACVVLLSVAAPLRAQEAAPATEAPALEAAPAETTPETAAEEVEEALEEAVEETPLLEADEESRELAARYLGLPAIQEMNDQLYGGNALDSMLSMQEGLPQEVRAAMSRILREEFAKLRPGLEAAMVETAAQTFTKEELEALIAFYETPEGASVARKTAPFSQRVFANFGEGMEEFQQTVVRRLMEELK